MKILNTLAWIKIHSIKLSRSGNQNVFLLFVEETFRYERWFMK